MRSLVATTLVVVLLGLALPDAECLRAHGPVKKAASSSSIPPWKTFYYTQQLDHFNFNDDRTFQQRYLVNGKDRSV